MIIGDDFALAAEAILMLKGWPKACNYLVGGGCPLGESGNILWAELSADFGRKSEETRIFHFHIVVNSPRNIVEAVISKLEPRELDVAVGEVMPISQLDGPIGLILYSLRLAYITFNISVV